LIQRTEIRLIVKRDTLARKFAKHKTNMTTKATNNGLKSLPFERRSSVKSIIGI
jgi:hypothetical protein